ncbi:MAG TPA: intradiol ring-cleavage dioxygenase [bacterium]|nr:intradiol ring-cleavage dioxygenase [bacterium]
MFNDDRPVGRISTRRETLALLSGTAGGVFVAAAAGYGWKGGTARAAGATPRACIVRPEQTEGPYFVDERLRRSDIRSDPSDGSVKPGVPLTLTFRVAQLSGSGCTPLRGAIVDVWHCDALGVYSDTRDPIFGDTRGRKFLRGYQPADAAGVAGFLTIYPGWYEGRAVHIHFRIRTGFASPAHEFTSQLYFDDTLTDRVHARQPYARKGRRTMRNAQDGIFRNGGTDLFLKPVPHGQGYAAAFDVALQIA